MFIIKYIKGPDDCEWYTIDNTHVQKFRKVVKKIFDLDIHKDEGLWFSNVDFCLENEIPVKKFVQKPGDIVYTNSGTLHWVRSKGIAVNSSWNVALKNVEVFQEMYRKLEINKTIAFPTIVPIRLLTLELLKKEYQKLQNDFFDLCYEKLKFFVQEEEDEKKKAKMKFIREPENSSVFFCDGCHEEIFLYWVHCENPNCLNKFNCYFCVKCCKSHERVCNSSQFQGYKKYDDFEIQDLIFELEEFKENQRKLTEKKENKMVDKKENKVIEKKKSKEINKKELKILEKKENKVIEKIENKKQNDEEKYKIKKKQIDTDMEPNNLMEHMIAVSKILHVKKDETKMETENILSALISSTNK